MSKNTNYNEFVNITSLYYQKKTFAEMEKFKCILVNNDE